MKMTKKTTAAADASTYMDSVKETIETVQSKMEVPAAAREFVQRAAATVKERAASVHTGANDVATGAERLATSFVGGYANFVRGVVDATFANVQHALDTVEKVAGAKTVNEAAQVQADFVRESAKANYERVRSAAETARTVITDGAGQVQAELAKLNPYAKKAA